MRTPRWTGIVLGMVAFALLAAGVVVYTLGTPISGQATSVASSAPSAPPDATGGAPARAEESSPLAIEIPGCVCHSDDPELVAEHATYRMNQCFECHAEGTPAMGE